jgi:PAS domain S-box-containing protein
MKKIDLKKVPLQKTIIFFILILGVVYIHYAWTRFKNDQTQEILQIARSIEATLPKESIKKLEAKSRDIDKPQYHLIKNTLKSIIRANPKARFAYLYTKRNGKIYFIADSEPAESKDCSPPGQEYPEADKATHQAFNNEKEIITNPSTDRWGTWISVLIPVKNEDTGKTFAVYGMDFDAKSWNIFLLFEIIKLSALIVISLFSFLFLFRIKDKNKMLMHDISVRKQADQILRESELKYRSLFENVQDVFYQTDLEGKFLEISPSIKQFMELTREEIFNHNIGDFYENPKDRLKMLNLIIQNGELRDYELKLRMKTGIIKYASINARLILDSQGKPSRIDGALRDITEREQSKEKLIESEYRLRTIIETEPECIKIVDENGKLVMMNPAGLAMIQADSLEQVVGNKAIDIIAPEYRKTFARMHKQVIAGHSMQKEFEILGLNGRRLWLETNAVPMLYKGKIVHLAHTRNITERKRAQEKLRESELFLKETQIIARLGTYVLNIKDGSWSSSDILDSILGINSNDHKSTQSWTAVVHPEFQELIQNYFKDEVITNKCKFNKEYKIIRKKDKKERWVHGLGEILFNEGNMPIKMIGTIQDITERKQIEEELLIAKEKAEESDRLKSAFLANMSHEIRTPMNGILGFAELLKEPNLTGEEKLEFIGIIEKSGVRMLNIINDIIDISKIESGLMKVSLSETNINEKMKFIYTFFKPEAESKKILLSHTNSLLSKEIIIKTDQEKIYAILTNLVKNALKFTQTGTIEMGYNLKAVKPKKVGMSGYLFEPYEIEFFVKDTGSGIDKEHIAIIFERFRQSSESLTRNYEGAGLGLSISKAYVEMLGGKIWVESEVGIGSTFYFTIPYNGAEFTTETETITHPIAEEKGEIKKLKILIAEDDEISAKLLTRTTKTIGKEVLRVRTGAEAIEICKNNPDIDLILMDIQMPEMDGYKTTQLIREFNKDVIIIAQTAYALSSDLDKAIASGCTDYISKPVNKVELLVLLQKYFTKVYLPETLYERAD